jgi:hypothetical protein
MSLGKLKYLSVPVCENLKRDIAANLDRYVGGTFEDLVINDGWSIELNLELDLAPLQRLDGKRTAEADFANAVLVWDALGKLTPGLATEARLWTRLTHLEGLKYSRERWLQQAKSKDERIEAINTHFFAETQTKYRDDNALGRLWWAAHIAKLAMPDDQLTALGAIVQKSTDIRSNIIERSAISSRPKLAAGIVRTIVREPKATSSEDGFRSFMKAVNRLGGGVVFEAMSDGEIDGFMDECVVHADSVKDQLKQPASRAVDQA